MHNKRNTKVTDEIKVLVGPLGSTVCSAADSTHAATRLQPGPEPPAPGPPPGPPSAPLDSEDDSSPPSEEQTHIIITLSSDQYCHLSDQTDEDTHTHTVSFQNKSFEIF